MAQAEMALEQAVLFEEMRIDMTSLQADRERNNKPARAPKTISEQTDDWRNFTRWCAEAGREPLPATAATLELYVESELRRKGVKSRRPLKTTTVSRRVSTILVKHKEAGVAKPSTDGAYNILANTRRKRLEQPGSKAALSPDELRRIVRALPKDQQGVRNRAILLVGFASAMRRSELSALDLADIEFTKLGFSIFIRQSKGDQEGQGAPLYIFHGNRATTCPLKALKGWLKVRGKWEGPLFTQMSGCGTGGILQDRLSGDAIYKVVTRSVESIGLDPKKYGGHTLRASCVTAALDAGESIPNIMERTRHKKIEMVARYHRPKPFSHDIMAKVL